MSGRARIVTAMNQISRESPLIMFPKGVRKKKIIVQVNIVDWNSFMNNK